MSILNFPQLVFNKSYLAISLLGVSYKLNVKYSNTLSIELIKKDNEIDLLLPKKYKNYDNSDIINLAIKDYKKRIAKTHSFDTNILKGFNGTKGLKGLKGLKGAKQK